MLTRVDKFSTFHNNKKCNGRRLSAGRCTDTINNSVLSGGEIAVHLHVFEKVVTERYHKVGSI